MTLFKYLTPDRLDVLSNREIRFTQAAALNDPFELRTYFDALVREQELIRHIAETPLDLTPHVREAYDKLPPEVRAKAPSDAFLAMAQQATQTPEGKRVFWATIATVLEFARGITAQLRNQMAEAFRTRIGILSLSEIPDCAPMWAHYADNHRGFVIGFDESNEFFHRRRGPEDEFFHLRRIDYRPPTVFADLTEMDGQKILAAKAPEWAYEREWRMLIPTTLVSRTIDVKGESVHLMSIPPQAIRSIIVGARSGESSKSQLADILAAPEYAHVSIHTALFDEREMRIAFEPVLASRATKAIG